MKKINSIRGKLLLFLIIILLFAFGTLSVTGYKFASKSLINSNLNIMKEMTKIVSDKALDEIRNEIKNIEILAENPVIKNKSIPMEEKFLFLMPLAGKSDIIEMGIGDVNGDFLNTTNEHKNNKTSQSYINSMDGKSSMTNPYVDAKSNEKVVTFSTPVKDDEDEVIGYITLTKNCNSFVSIVDETKFLDTENIIIVDSYGNILASSNSEIIKENSNITEMKYNDVSLDKLSNIGKNMIISKECTVDKYDFEGINKYISYIPIGETGLFLGITAEERDLFKALGSLKTVNVIVTVVMIIAIYIIMAAVLLNIIKKLTEAKNYVDTISKGDFKSRVEEKFLKGNDEVAEICKSINNAKDSVSNMIGLVKNGSKEVIDESSKLLNISSKLSQSTEEIYEAIEKVSASTNNQNSEFKEITNILNIFSEKIDGIKKNINLINKEVIDVYDKSNNANKNINRLKDSLEGFNTKFLDFNKSIYKTGSEIKKINNIMDIINDISDETNMLSLNASIEAARAGELGKGFAVVAGEIGKLAQESKESSQDIYKIIKGLIHMIEGIVSDSKVMGEELELQRNIIFDILELFSDINLRVKEVAPKISDIDSQFVNITHNKKGILDSVNNLSDMVERNVREVGIINNSADNLATLQTHVNNKASSLLNNSKVLMKEIKKFKI